MQDEGIVIGEGVLLDARPTSFASRLAGAIIDLIALGLVGIAVAWLITRFAIAAPSDDVAQIVFVVVLVTILIVIPTTVDTLTRGRSLGKLAVGIRVVRDDGGPIRFRQAFVRALVGILELWLTLGSVALITSLVNPQGKRLGDLLAGTYAVRVRGRTAPRAVIVMPPFLAGWARSADVARLPDGLALSVRQFLGRAARLHPGSRHALGQQLAGEVARYVSPGPPAGTHPEAFLAAVLATRRDREYAATTRAAERSAQEAATLHRLPHGVPDPAR
ncbi:RDD family protein [Cellulomonas pakistanensis]|uniref:RDD family protein n=1 Tax=Cellulomonas pakistanensis TaxID=992287 RepID=A0A919PDC2_9CELL|nr:RDD family protein [Cellulomonas pakistanensis]GIG36122.1 RDD family protein [Cellulomonas pakistanensis]